MVIVPMQCQSYFVRLALSDQCLENPHNIGGGSIWPLEALSAVVDAGRRRRLALHLDGARLWHARSCPKTSIGNRSRRFRHRSALPSSSVSPRSLYRVRFR